MRIAIQGLVVVVAAAVAGCGTAAGVCGCRPYDCAEWGECKDPGDEAPAPVPVPVPACVADPAAAPPEDGCGVFVSSTLGSDDHPGTRALPVRTFERALTLAEQGPGRVYACAELFAEAVSVPAGVEVWGGLDCAAGWIYAGAEIRTTLSPGPDEIPLRVLPGDGRSVVADVRAEAAGAMLPGGSSIAALVAPGAAVEILRSELVAGDGAPGAPGEDGGDAPAAAGATGTPGAPACSATDVAGGVAVTTTCGAFSTVGGQGGFGGLNGGGPGTDGQPEPIPNPMEWGRGGAGQDDALQCIFGFDGQNGTDAPHGLGASGPGRITLSGWAGKPGQDGGDGLPAQGGGGGGGSRGGSLACGLGPDTLKGGASGGSGGGGGCGGRGGTGGGYGGASIGLLTLSGDVVIRATSITAGRGGDGGAGGLAQFGGPGGLGGLGGPSVGGSAPGCPGGDGGKGGNGGYGGGGLGGPSIAVAHLIGGPPAQESVDLTAGAPGKGGPGGNAAVPSSAGEDGVEGSLLAFP